MTILDTRRVELDKLVSTWLAHSAVFDMYDAAGRSCKYFPEIGWSVVKELVRQAPNDEALRKIALTREPLETLIVKHGPAFIDRIEAEARTNVVFKKCLGMIDIAANRIPAELWNRLAGASERELRVRPHSEPKFLREEEPNIEFMLDYDFHPMTEAPSFSAPEMAASWLTYWETFWAWEDAREVLERGGDEAWFVISELITRSPTERGLGAIGAGPLEDWLQLHGPKVIGLLEGEAARDRRWRVAVSSVWQGDMTDELWERVVRTRGDEPERG